MSAPDPSPLGISTPRATSSHPALPAKAASACPPLPALAEDPRARHLRESFAEESPAAALYAKSTAGSQILGMLARHSPFLSDLALREAETLLAWADEGPDTVFQALMKSLHGADPAADHDAASRLLRRLKRQVALLVALADLTGQWPLQQITGALSDFAEAAIEHALAHLLLAHTRTATERLHAPPAPTTETGGLAHEGRTAHEEETSSTARRICQGSGVIVLAMGKLGGRELNYSSDVDLMVLYEPGFSYHGTALPGQIAKSTTEAAEADGESALAARLARDLVRLMEERTAEGYVFRTDLRLRPDPGATPLAVSVPAAVLYYQTLGQNWERAALIKARPVAGDRAAGEGFLREIRPFIWRRHLDFAAIADIHSIKRQIHAAKSGRGAGASLAVAGHDIKLGRGGIREIEFTAQVLQLIWGGRDPSLRGNTTLGALQALAAAGHMKARAASQLAEAYVFLRTLEHRLQMVADRQTHRLPQDEAGLTAIAQFMGYADAPALGAALTQQARQVERHYAQLFEDAPALSAEGSDIGGNLVFTGVDDDPETLATLQRLGFQDPPSVAALVRSWHYGRPRATRSTRARELLTELMPRLLAAFGRQSQPETALGRFDALLRQRAAGVQLFSMLCHDTALLDRLAGILGAAPRLADHLVRNPGALDGLLTDAEQPVDGAPEPAEVAASLGAETALLGPLVKDARHLEEALDAARRMTLERHFAIDTALLEGRIGTDAASLLRSDLADAALQALLPLVQADFARRHGRVPQGALVIVALGKLGGREMLPGSDLDLLLLYDHPAEAVESQGRRGQRPLAASEYYLRLSQQLVALLTAQGAEGRLYQVDMRLRPSGSQGPVAVRLDRFIQYHSGNAWAWERMALSRARVVAGPASLRRKVEQALAEALTRETGAAAIPAEAAAMRGRLLRDLPPEGAWDIKQRAGGLVEVEFIAQALQLAHAPAQPGLLRSNTGAALLALAEAGMLPQPVAVRLEQAGRVWRMILSLLRLTVGRVRADRVPGPTVQALLRGAAQETGQAPADLAGLQALMDATAHTVREAFLHYCGDIEPGNITLPEGSASPKSALPATTPNMPRPAPASGKAIAPAPTTSRHPARQRKPSMTSSLEPGTPAPAFDLPASGGRRVSLAALQGQPFLLYFYPKASTPGCTQQACGIQEALPQLQKLGITVIGVSPDGLPAIEKFAAKYGLEFPLASDAEHAAAEAYGTWVQKSMYGKTYMGMERSSFLVGRDGRLVRIWRKVKPAEHAAAVMEAVRQL